MARPHRAVRGSLPTVAFAVFIAACAPRGEQAPAASAPAAPRAEIPAPQPAPPFSRADLLQAIDRAASDLAGGQKPSSRSDLSNRKFQIALAFRCAGTVPDPKLGYVLNLRAGTLRLSARPDTFDDWKPALVSGGDVQAGDEIEAIEGFWIRRPWMRGQDCPAGRPQKPAATPTPETAALVQAFEAGGSRLLRRAERPYAVTRSASEAGDDFSRGFRLVLQGRLADVEGGPIRCRGEEPDRRPVCVVMVNFERVAFETPEGDQLAEWRS